MSKNGRAPAGARKRPIGIDLFCGAGGLSLGFEQAGFDVLVAADIDPIHCAVHKFNFPLSAAIPMSVVELTPKKIREEANIGDREIDCVFGGAPCQGFSLIGHRALDDPRNQLVKEFVRIVSELNARTFVFENVKGLTVGKHRGFLQEIVEEFEAAGYDVRIPWKVLNAGHYGTPQSRERLFLFGARKGKALPEYPDPITEISGREPKFERLFFGPSCADALGDLPNADDFEALAASDEMAVSGATALSEYAAELKCLTNDAWHFGYVREWDPSLLTSSAQTQHTDISKRRFADTEEGTVEPISRFFKLPAEGVSNTLRAGTDGARGAFTSPRPIHYAYPRCVTVREMARLHGFPDWFRFHVTKWHGARQIGNSVPPPLARAIATSVIDALGVRPVRPSKSIELGERGLLELDMSDAAAHFGTEPLANRRDRKSGAKKRKQEEIEADRLASASL